MSNTVFLKREALAGDSGCLDRLGDATGRLTVSVIACLGPGPWSLEAGHRCHPRSGMVHPHCAQTSQVRQSAHLSCSAFPLGISGDYHSLSHISFVLGTSVKMTFSVFQVSNYICSPTMTVKRANTGHHSNCGEHHGSSQTHSCAA